MKFNPEQELPQDLWDSIQKADEGEAAFRTYLHALDKEQFVRLFRYFIDARTEMAYLIWDRPEGSHESEDTLDDLADAIVTQGRDSYLGIYRGTKALPKRDVWRDLPIIGHLFAQVSRERFDQNVYDFLED
jgi:hypothetical protein